MVLKITIYFLLSRPFENQYLVSGQLKTTTDFDKIYIWARDMFTILVTWSLDTFFWQLSINHNVTLISNIKDVCCNQVGVWPPWWAQIYKYRLLLFIIKCSSYCERYDWSVWVHYSSIKHSAYVTRVHYNSTYARKLRHENFALDKIWESASPPLWLKNFHGFNSVSNSWTPKKVAALRSLKMRHLFQRKKGL